MIMIEFKIVMVENMIILKILTHTFKLNSIESSDISNEGLRYIFIYMK
jgi:hypothetical protein